jgi:copper transport protein
VWLGGLVALATTVPRSQVIALAGRFSPIALCSVIVLAATGVFNSWRQIGSWAALTDSDYGTWLIVKLTLLGAVVAIAVTSRWLLRQSSMAVPGSEMPTASTVPTPANVALARTVIGEVVGIVLVLAATAGLVNAAPPRALAVPAIASTTVAQGQRLAQITLDPPVTGGTALHIYLSGSSGSLEQPTDITVTASLPAQDIGPLPIPVVPAGPGHVTATAANLPLAGTWTFSVVARYSEFDQVTFTGDLEVR